MKVTERVECERDNSNAKEISGAGFNVMNLQSFVAIGQQKSSVPLQ